MNEKGTALFKKRYQHVLRFQTFWIGFYVIFMPYLLPKRSPVLEMIWVLSSRSLSSLTSSTNILDLKLPR